MSGTSRDSVKNTLFVASALCVFCSLLVSASAVGLRPRQLRNKERARQLNILKLTQLDQEGQSIAKSFEQIETRILDLETGEFVSSDVIDPATFDQRRAASEEQQSIKIPSEEDFAGIGRREKHSLVYLAKIDDKVDQIVLPMYGNGLWSTMYGFLALDADGTTIRGLSFYEHGETPGLGGEVDNPAWKAFWTGKKAFDENGEIQIRVVKGSVDASHSEADYHVDGISGATITCNGVTNMLSYWLGPNAYGPFLQRLKTKGIDSP